MKILWKTK